MSNDVIAITAIPMAVGSANLAKLRSIAPRSQYKFIGMEEGFIEECSAVVVW